MAEPWTSKVNGWADMDSFPFSPAEPVKAVLVPGPHGPQNRLAAPASPDLQPEIVGMQSLLEAVPDAMMIVDAQGIIIMVNSRLELLLGWTQDELSGRGIEVVVPGWQRLLRSATRADGRLAAPEERTDPGADLRAARRDGPDLPADIAVAWAYTSSGPLMTVVVRDESERRAMREKFRLFVESSPDAVVIADQAGTMVVVNSQTEVLFGYTRAELIGQSVTLIVPQPHLDRTSDDQLLSFASSKIQAMGAGLGAEVYGQRKDGSQFPIDVSQSPLQTESGLLVSSAIRDVTEQREADELRFRLAAIVDGSDDAIISTTLTDIVTSWNRGAQALFGYTAQEMIGHSLGVLLPPDRAGENFELLAGLQRDERIRNRDSLRRTKDGRDIVVSMTISPIRDQNGVLIGGSKVARDITDRTNAERALAEAKERAETASREYEAFSYSVAHDLRAPLRALDGFSHKLVERYADVLDDAGQDYLDRISGSAQYMAQLIEALLRLARLSNRELVTEPVDLSALVSQAIDRLRSQSPDRHVAVVIEPGMQACGDRGLLTIVFDNLLSNAWKFSRHQDGAAIDIGRRITGGQSEYFVRDNGAGFDMAYQDKLFGVFQRLHTSAEFEGTGIGLVTVQRIVQRHGGKIWAESSPGRGAIFFFTLETTEQ